MALDAIDDFCAKDLEFDPKKANSKKGRLEAQTGFSQDGKWSWPKTSKNGITIEVVNGETCDKDTPKENKKFKTGGPACKRKLADLILDGCDTNTRQNKKGGSLLESVSLLFYSSPPQVANSFRVLPFLKADCHLCYRAIEDVCDGRCGL